MSARRTGPDRVRDLDRKRPADRLPTSVAIVGGAGDIPPGLADALLALMDKGRAVGRG